MLDTHSVLDPTRTRWSDARARSLPELYEKPHARALLDIRTF